MRRFLKTKALLLLALIGLSVLMRGGALNRPDPRPRQGPAGLITSTFKSRFKLGLDLQGGLHLEYSVAVDEALEAGSSRSRASCSRPSRKRNVVVDAQRVGLDRVDIKFADPSQVATAEDDVLGIALSDMERVDTQDEASGVIHLKMLAARLAENRSSAVSQALDTVRRRIDAMGIAEPNIYPKNRQIVIELPGLSDTTAKSRRPARTSSPSCARILLTAGAGQITVTEKPPRARGIQADGARHQRP